MYREYVAKAIATGKAYTELPAKVRAAVPLQEWCTRVRELCIQQGCAWSSSQASSVCSELEYYEQLVDTYTTWGRLYPYHLAEYVARVLRITPFRYYIDMLFLWLKEERSYDRLPNFSAADALRLTGVGRNEYIATLNACKSKRLMWRLNKGLARELLPQVPLDIRMEPYWLVCVVNVGESEFRELSPDEASLLRAAAEGSSSSSSSSSRPGPPVSAFDPVLLQQLYKRSLVYLHIPVLPGDRFSILPLEGFVSNKTSEAGDTSVDPLEPLLYRLFLANSSRLDQERLADILGIDLPQLQTATALAVRLGFATRIPPINPSGNADEASAAATPTVGLTASARTSSASSSSISLGGLAAAAAGGAGGGQQQQQQLSHRHSSSSQALRAAVSGGLSGGDPTTTTTTTTTSTAIPDSLGDQSAVAAAATGAGAEGTDAQGGVWPSSSAAAAAAPGVGVGGSSGSGRGGIAPGGVVAVVVDSETTSVLMMGALSAGLKRHSVSLFEGGRVSGEAVVAELIGELQASAAAGWGALFEGEDMAQLMRVIESLGVLLACVRDAVAPQGCTLELLRQESFAGLDPQSAAKVLSATYSAILPISPLPGHTLPRLLCQQLKQQQQQKHHHLGGPSRTSSSASIHTTNTPTATSSNQALVTGSTAAAAAAAVAGVGSGVIVPPTFFGPPSPEADSPWLQLALYAAARAGPVSLVFVAGCRVWKLPPQLQGCTHALLWGWGPAAAGGAAAAADTRPLMVEGSHLLCTLNELLSRTAVMVQPLVHLDQLPPPLAAAEPEQEPHLVRFVDVPLPLCTCEPGASGGSSSSQQPGGSSSQPSSIVAAAGGGGGGGGAAVGGGEDSPAAPLAAESLQQQQQHSLASSLSLSWDPFGVLGNSSSSSTAEAAASASTQQHQQQQPHKQQQQQQALHVQAVDRTGSSAGQLRRLAVPGQVVAALHQLQLAGAVGWLRLVRLPPPAAAASGLQQKQPWVPLSVNLGVPLFCPALCQLVCANMTQQRCLTPPGEAAWRSAQQQLQQQLAEHVGLPGSGSSSVDDAQQQPHQGGLAVEPAASAQQHTKFAAAAMAGDGVMLPSHSLLFSGHSLLPVDISGCLQGAQLW